MSYTNKYLPGVALQTPQEVAAYIAANPGDERARWWKIAPSPQNPLGLTTDDIPEGLANLYYNPSRVTKEIQDAVDGLAIPGVIAYAHSQVFSGNPHGTTPDDIGAFAKVFVGGGIDFHGFATPGVYEIRGNSWANGWAGLTGTQDVALLQMHDADGRRFLVAGDGKYGGLMLKFQASEIPGDHWSPWFTVWDSGSLPASTVGKAVLAAASQAAARAAIGAAPLPSKVDVSTSGNLGDISASTIKVTASGVTLALTGGIDGQGWDIVNPIYDVDFQLPSGVTLFRDGGTTLGPGTYTLGYNRAIRMVRVDASTWMLPNLW